MVLYGFGNVERDGAGSWIEVNTIVVRATIVLDLEGESGVRGTEFAKGRSVGEKADILSRYKVASVNRDSIELE